MVLDSVQGALPVHSREVCPWAITCPQHRTTRQKPATAAIDARRLPRHTLPNHQKPLTPTQRRTREAFDHFLKRLDEAQGVPA